MTLKLPNSLGYGQWLFLTDYGMRHRSVNRGRGANGFILVPLSPVPPQPPHYLLGFLINSPRLHNSLEENLIVDFVYFEDAQPLIKVNL